MIESSILAGRLVTVEEFIQYLVTKNVSSKCPSCEHEGAFVSADTGGNNAVQTRSDAVKFNMSTMGILPSAGETVLSLSTVCDNCGYIRSYAAQSVYEWLDKKRAEK